MAATEATQAAGGVGTAAEEGAEAARGLPLVVHLEDDQGGAGRLPLFVTLAGDEQIDDDLRREIASALRSRLSPRHVPDELHQMPALPRTLSGKKLEVPVKKILQGVPIEKAAAPGALADPTALEPFADLR